MSNLTDFIKNELYPALFDRVDEAFPSMQFQRYKGGWASPYKLNGERSHDGRKEKSQITRKVPTRIFEQGDVDNSKDLLDFYKEQNGITETIEAVKQLSDICRLTLPTMEDSETYRAYKEKQDGLERISSRMQAALFEAEGRGTLDYLRGRGYEDEFIRRAGFGFVSPSLRDELRNLFSYTNRDGEEKNSLPYDIGLSYFLAIPYRAGGNIQGFVFRTTSQGAAPKYKDAFIS